MTNTTSTNGTHVVRHGRSNSYYSKTTASTANSLTNHDEEHKGTADKKYSYGGKPGYGTSSALQPTK